jgi:excisionase family DNA binding protein
MPERYMNANQTAEYLHVSIASIRRYVRDRVVPYSKVGNRVLFDREQVDQWIASIRVNPLERNG